MAAKVRLSHLVYGLTSLLAVSFVAVLSGFILLDRFVRESTQPYLYATVADLPSGGDAGLVLGAQVLPGGRPSEALANRLETGVEAYRQGKVGVLLMSGDGRSRYYDEVEAMRAYAVEHGVPKDRIVLDPNGLRTYASCYRARHEFNAGKVVIVAQEDHLRRSLYTCRSLGLDAVGVAAPEFGETDAGSTKARIRYLVREKAALVLAWLDLTMLRPSS